MSYFLPVILLNGELSFQLCNLSPDCAEQLTGFGTFAWNCHQKQKQLSKTGQDEPEEATDRWVQNSVRMVPKAMLTFFETRRLVDTLEHC